MSKPRNIRFTGELLRDYTVAALANASELIAEAAILYKHGHYARAYFLAVAAIEETGKAFLAFYGQGRNLSDSAVAAKLKRFMEDHSQKITAAFAAWVIAAPNVSEIVSPAIDLMLHLKHGREPSMYTDIGEDSVTVKIPATMVREKASFDCIRLAKECLAHTQKHISEKPPQPCSRAEDQLFSMRGNQFQKIADMEDFWWYYLAEMEAGRKDLAEAVVSYRDNYVSRGIVFRSPSNGGAGNDT